jgi:hypothetical protein
MERVLHANEETALNPDPFDPVEPEFVAGAVVGLGTMRQGSDAAPAVPMRAASSCNGYGPLRILRHSQIARGAIRSL